LPERLDSKAFLRCIIEFPPVSRHFFFTDKVIALLFGQFGTNTPHRFSPTIRDRRLQKAQGSPATQRVS
jgi:hypothetical protein